MKDKFKTFYLTAVCLITLFSCNKSESKFIEHKPNYIDSIQNAKQIKDLILKIDTNLSYMNVTDSLITGEGLRTVVKEVFKINKPWSKADFDQNGLTDILVIYDNDIYGFRGMCILDKGNKFEVKFISCSDFDNYLFPIVQENKIKCYILDDDLRDIIPKQFNLIYKFNDFIEENKNPTNYKIEKIEFTFRSGYCFENCDDLYLTIESDRKANWLAKRFKISHRKEVKKNFKTVITEDTYNEIIDLINYSEFEKVNSDAFGCDDCSEVNLKITYNNGKTKTIIDNKLDVKFSLKKLYSLLLELTKNQKWTEYKN